MVQEQLEKEAEIRAKVEKIKFRLARGLSLVQSLATAHVELHAYMSTIIGVLLKGAFSATSVALVGFAGFEAYMVSICYCQRPWTVLIARSLRACLSAAQSVSTRTDGGSVSLLCAH